MPALSRIMKDVRAHKLNKGRLETLIQLTSFSLLTPPITVGRAAFRALCLFGSPGDVRSGFCRPDTMYSFCQKNNSILQLYLLSPFVPFLQKVPLVEDKVTVI